MISVKFVPNARGFLKDLLQDDKHSFRFTFEKTKFYETNSFFKVMVAKAIRSRLFDYFGIFRVLKVDTSDNCILSDNRFLETNKPYVIYLENPLAPVHYSIGRTHTTVSKIKLNKLLNDRNLKAIVCYSKACMNTVPFFYDLPSEIKLINIYPYVKTLKKITLENIKERANRDFITLLYVSSNFELKGGKDILACCKEKLSQKIKLIIVTKIDTISEEDKLFIDSNSDYITLYDFVLSKDELASLYCQSNILLNPTRQDSYSLVVLEAMKYGNAIISSKMYAIPEMVEDGREGFLTKAKYEFWTDTNLPNKEVWNNRKNTIYSHYVDGEMVSFLKKKIETLGADRDLLYSMQCNALKKSNSGEFSDDYILTTWEKLFESVVR